jgi:hypothetical protein
MSLSHISLTAGSRANVQLVVITGIHGRTGICWVLTADLETRQETRQRHMVFTYGLSAVIDQLHDDALRGTLFCRLYSARSSERTLTDPTRYRHEAP